MDKEIALIVRTCMNQKINNDPDVDDTGREWWYVSELYGPMDDFGEVHQGKFYSIGELVEKIKNLRLKSLKAIEIFNLFKRKVIQVQGDRLEIIKECESIINK